MPDLNKKQIFEKEKLKERRRRQIRRIQELEEELRGIKRVNEERPEEPIEKKIKIAPSTSSSHDEAGPSKKFLSHEEWEKKFEKFKTEMEAKFKDQEEKIKQLEKKNEDQEGEIKLLKKKIEDQEREMNQLHEENDIAHAEIATLNQYNLRLSQLVPNQVIIANQPLAVNGHQVEEPQILPNDHHKGNPDPQPQGLHLQGGIPNPNQLLLAALNADPAPQHPPLGINPQDALEEDVDEEDGDEP